MTAICSREQQSSIQRAISKDRNLLAMNHKVIIIIILFINRNKIIMTTTK